MRDKYEMNLSELLQEVAYSWEPHHPITKTKDGYFVNKLSITKTEIEYKGHYTTLAPGVFEEFEQFLQVRIL
jgi:hypothetical protein